jgi:membrane-associated phospholipid phosphatase
MIRHPLRAAFLLLSLPFAAPLSAQTPDSIAIRPVHGPYHVRAWQVGAAIGTIAAASLADKKLRTWVLDNRTPGQRDIATAWERWGAEGAIGVTVGTLGAGLLLHKSEVTRTGERLAATLAGVSVVAWGLKESIGRHRPNEASDQYTFDPFDKFNSFPSGHTIVAFGVSTVLADAIHNKWADLGLYTLAAGTGVSRMVGNHHWLSDVVASGFLGVTTAKVVDGKWTIFGIHSPEFLTGPGGYGLRWTADIPALRGRPSQR